MRPLIVHASSKVDSDLPRRVLHIEYAQSLDFGDGLPLAIAGAHRPRDAGAFTPRYLSTARGTRQS